MAYAALLVRVAKVRLVVPPPQRWYGKKDSRNDAASVAGRSRICFCGNCFVNSFGKSLPLFCETVLGNHYHCFVTSFGKPLLSKIA
jgi:hypothetical protein